MVTAEAVVAPDRIAAAWRALRDVVDPEIPVLSILDLGIVRFVRTGPGTNGADELHVGLTPTYSGCPATEVIRASVARALTRAGFSRVRIDNVLSPPWTSQWITDEGRRKLQAFGIPRR